MTGCLSAFCQFVYWRNALAIRSQIGHRCIHLHRVMTFGIGRINLHMRGNGIAVDDTFTVTHCGTPIISAIKTERGFIATGGCNRGWAVTAGIALREVPGGHRRADAHAYIATLPRHASCH